MNDPDRLIHLSDAFFDRIVEGDLSPAEVRAALERIEGQPDGWKRCALAFLEAQCWRASFRAIDSQAPVFSHSNAQRPGLRRLAMAAGIAAVAFAGGWRARPDRTGPSLVAAPPSVVKASPAASGDLESEVVPPTSIVDPRTDRPAPPEASPTVGVIRQVRVVPVNGATAISVMVRPKVDGPSIQTPSPSITEHQLALLEQRGYQVDRRRRLITATLSNGRRVTVPIDQIRLRFTGIEPL